MKINSKDPASLKRPTDDGLGLEEERPAQRARISEGSTSRSTEKTKEMLPGSADSVERRPASDRPPISISLTGLAKPKTSGFNALRPNILSTPSRKEEGNSQRNRRALSPERGKILMSGPNPLKNPPFWRERDLEIHAGLHMEDTKSASQEEYEKKSLKLLASPVSIDKPAYIRETGLPSSERYPGRSPPREAGDVVRHDRSKDMLAVAKSSGRARTYHSRESSGPGYSGLPSEAADDHMRRLNAAKEPKK